MKLLASLFIPYLALAAAELQRNSLYYSNKAGGVSDADVKALHSRCTCANETVAKIKNHLDSYDKDNNAVEALVSSIKDIAQECTAHASCKCPEGYFKSRDHRCLQFSRSAVSCKKAVKECKANFNSRLAIAKDPESLLNLQTYLQQAGHSDYYWIGLSYEKTNQYDHDMRGNWLWDDRSRATSYTKTSMGLYENTNVKKAAAQLRMVDIKSSLDNELVRVAIKADDNHGLSYETGFCTEDSDNEDHKFKYICEFLMFQVDVRPSNQL